MLVSCFSRCNDTMFLNQSLSADQMFHKRPIFSLIFNTKSMTWQQRCVFDFLVEKDRNLIWKERNACILTNISLTPAAIKAIVDLININKKSTDNRLISFPLNDLSTFLLGFYFASIISHPL